MFAKNKRIDDRKTVENEKKDYCEYCGSPASGDPHHIISKGAGGPCIKHNLIQLCYKCHVPKAHSGKISREALFSIVAEREGITAEECQEIVNEARRTGVYA